MPDQNWSIGWQQIAMKFRFLISWLVVYLLLENSSFSIAQSTASERHIDDIDVHFHEHHLEDDFRPSEILGPIGEIKTSGPKITNGESLIIPKPKKPHWLGGRHSEEDRYVIVLCYRYNWHSFLKAFQKHSNYNYVPYLF